jgi:hypothetical protein
MAALLIMTKTPNAEALGAYATMVASPLDRCNATFVARPAAPKCLKGHKSARAARRRSECPPKATMNKLAACATANIFQLS